LQTKIQFKDFEPGEFTNEKDRTIDETIDLITSFPWQDERDHLVVSLTNPGITIEGSSNDYLKLAPFYNGKYVLHYFDSQHHLYTRSFEKPEDSIPTIRSFFETQPFDPTGFRRETTLLQNNTVHFVTGDFRYTFDKGHLFQLSFVTLYLVVIAGLLTMVGFKQPVALVFALPLIALLLYMLALFINHYKAAHGKVLLVSKGLDAFSYGPADNPKTFYKHDIANIITYGQRQRGNSYGPLSIVEINFKNGSWLQISCLMLNYLELVGKFPKCAKSEEPKWFPFMSRESALPEF